MTYDASDPKQVKEKAKDAKADEAAQANFIKNVMTSREGRLWMRTLLETTHVFRTSFAVEAMKMAFMEGERNVGLKILSDIMSFCPDKYIEMMKETENE